MSSAPIPTPAPPQILVYAYPSSPFYQKLSLILLLKRLPHTLVPVPNVLPRPELSSLLGITYRRIPVLAILGPNGADFYCDTSCALEALEERFGEGDGWGTVFPEGPAGKMIGLQRGASFDWADRPLFRTVTSLIPEQVLTPEFIKDRSQFRGGPLDKKAMLSAAPISQSALRSHLARIESQLQTRPTPLSPFLLSTPTPSLIDTSLFFSLNWLSLLRTVPNLLHPPQKNPYFRTSGPPKSAEFETKEFGAVLEWIEEMRWWFFCASKQVGTTKCGKEVNAEEARKLVLDCIKSSSSPSSSDSDGEKGNQSSRSSLGFRLPSDTSYTSPTLNTSDPILKILSPSSSSSSSTSSLMVAVTPDDTGKIPQVGRLVGLNDQVVVLEVDVPEVGRGEKVRVWFPRFGFSIKKAAGKKDAKL